MKNKPKDFISLLIAADDAEGDAIRRKYYTQNSQSSWAESPPDGPLKDDWINIASHPDEVGLVVNFKGLDEQFRNWVWLSKGKQFYNFRTDRYLEGAEWSQRHTAYLCGMKTSDIYACVIRGKFFGGHQIPLYEGLSYRPGNESRRVDVDCFNMWDPPVDPVPYDHAKMQPLLDHLMRMFPDNDEFCLYLDFLWWIFNKPEEKLLTSLLITGPPGAGKTLCTEGLISSVLGESEVNGCEVSEILGDYQEFAKFVKVVVIREMSSGGKRALYDLTKTMSTERTIRVNTKYVPVFSIDNYVSLIANSNDAAPLRLPDGDRRWNCISSEEIEFPTKAERDAYYNRLAKLIHGNPGMILDFFLNVWKPEHIKNTNTLPINTHTRRMIIDAGRASIEDLLDEFLDMCVNRNIGIFRNRDFVRWASANAPNPEVAKSASYAYQRAEAYKNRKIKTFVKRPTGHRDSSNFYRIPGCDLNLNSALKDIQKAYEDQGDVWLNV